jgi:hypothetical protein
MAAVADGHYLDVPIVNLIIEFMMMMKLLAVEFSLPSSSFLLLRSKHSNNLHLISAFWI